MKTPTIATELEIMLILILFIELNRNRTVNRRDEEREREKNGFFSQRDKEVLMNRLHDRISVLDTFIQMVFLSFEFYVHD